MEKLVRKYHHTIEAKLQKEIGLLRINQKQKLNIKGGVVYILKALNDNTSVYKIGRSDDIKKKMKTYNSGNANDTIPLFILKVNDVESVENV